MCFESLLNPLSGKTVQQNEEICTTIAKCPMLMTVRRTDHIIKKIKKKCYAAQKKWTNGKKYVTNSFHSKNKNNTRIKSAEKIRTFSLGRKTTFLCEKGVYRYIFCLVKLNSTWDEFGLFFIATNGLKKRESSTLQQ